MKGEGNYYDLNPNLPGIG